MREYDEDICYIKLFGYCNCDREIPCMSNCEFLRIINKSQLPNLVGSNLKLIPSDIDVKTFDMLHEIQCNVYNFVDRGRNLFIYGSMTGNGKTTWAIKILLAYFAECAAYRNEYQPGYFIHVPTFVTNLKMHINLKMPDFEQMLLGIEKADLVIWDDICTSDTTKYEFDAILSYIDRRKLANYSNIFTSNLDPKRMRNIIDERLYSRIMGSKVLKISGPDRRMAT